MPYPEELGQPCWSPEQVRKVISLTAHTSAESAPYFLAAHSPFERITDAKSGGRQLTEEQVFQELFSTARGEVQAFVKGEPGTGKSHLIRWLKLRAEDAKARGEKGFETFKLVLISRGNGSLKDALGQVVEQLGEEFNRHIDPIRGAIDKLSDHAARDTLLSKLALEIGTHWSTRHSETPLPTTLQHLAAALAPTGGFGTWMKRDGGVIHQVIRRLTEPSSVDDREEFPSFCPDDFEVDITYLRPDTTPGNVIAFADDLMEEDDRRELAAKFLNIALKNAKNELTGLSASDLLEIFNKIRRDLGPRKQLAVFIEDVSVTGLDQDVINAFEARKVDGLSRMVAVLGVTQSGWSRLDDNKKQRADFAFQVGGQVAEQWAGDRLGVTAFTARYLNAVRMDEDGIKSVAAARFSGDVAQSACDPCQLREACFKYFGKVELSNETEIGLFPLNLQAPKALLSSLNDAYYKSQRGLLDRVLLPALDQSYRALVAHEFPEQSQFAVKPPVFKFDWVAFANRYLGGVRWGEDEKRRIRFLACYWTDATSVADAASQLKPLLAPLGLPKFSSEVAPPPPPTPGGGREQQPQPPVATEDPALERLLSASDAWLSGSDLSQDAEFRKFVGVMLRNSVAWADQRGTPITISKTSAGRLIDGHAFVKIQGQVARPAAQTFFFDLDRSKETKELLESLASFERRNRSWEFPHSEIHKRKISRWLRRNRLRVVESLRPNPVSLVESSRRCAIQILALVASIRDRREMPSNAAERLDLLFKPLWEASSRPVVFSAELEQIVSDLESKHASIRSFVIREFGAGQGDAEPKDFIDPSPILDVLDEFAKGSKVEPPSSQVAAGFWKTRLIAVSRLEAYASLNERFQKERLAIQRAIEEARNFVEAAGFEAVDLRENLNASLKELIEVISLQRGGQHKRAILPLPNEEFDQLWQKKAIQTADIRSSWSVALGRAIDVSTKKDLSSLLTFDPAKLKECIAVLRTVEKFLELVDKHIQEEETYDGLRTDSRSQLLVVLKEIENLAVMEEKGASSK